MLTVVSALTGPSMAWNLPHTFIHTKKVRMKAFRKEWVVHMQWKQGSLDIGNQIPDSLGIQGKRGGSGLLAVIKHDKWKKDNMKHRCFCKFEQQSFYTIPPCKIFNKFIRISYKQIFPPFQFFIAFAKRDLEWMYYKKAVKATRRWLFLFQPFIVNQSIRIFPGKESP